MIGNFSSDVNLCAAYQVSIARDIPEVKISSQRICVDTRKTILNLQSSRLHTLKVKGLEICLVRDNGEICVFICVKIEIRQVEMLGNRE